MLPCGFIIILLLLLCLGIPSAWSAENEKNSNSSNFSICNKPGAFLGVANSECIGNNISTAIFLISIIIFISIVLELIVNFIRRSINCPQMRKIVNRLFEELMIMGFISTIIFAISTAKLSWAISDFNDELTTIEEKHFIEFFHFVVFLTMVYYIFIIIVLVIIATVVPRYLWQDVPESGNDKLDDATFNRIQISGEILTCSIAYRKICKEHEKDPWMYILNLPKRFQLWKSLEILGFCICRDRSRPIFTNKKEMQRIFGISVKESEELTYRAYNTLCIRNMLLNITGLHYSSFFVLLGIVLLCSLFSSYASVIFICIGIFLLLLSIIIMIKTSRILQGIVKDRLSVYPFNNRIKSSIMENVGKEEKEEEEEKEKEKEHQLNINKPSFKTLAICVRAIIRMQMSALCHQALHYHDNRFWFHSPSFLLRCFQFSTIGQAFYLVWFSLVQGPAISEVSLNGLQLFFMLLMPILTLFVIAPLTMPSLVLVLSLTGFFIEQNQNDQSKYRSLRKKKISPRTRDHIRRIRRSYQRNSRISRRESDDGSFSTVHNVFSPTDGFYRNSMGRASPNSLISSSLRSPIPQLTTTILPSPSSDVFLRFYDHPSPSSIDENYMNYIQMEEGWNPKGNKNDDNNNIHEQIDSNFKGYCNEYGGYHHEDNNNNIDDQTIKPKEEGERQETSENNLKEYCTDYGGYHTPKPSLNK